MKASSIAAVIAALTLASCGELPLALSYATGQHDRVGTYIPYLGITHLDVYQSPSHPTKIWVQAKNSVSIAMNGFEDQWVALLPRIEPAYGAAALKVLAQHGLANCELTHSVPMPQNSAIEYAYVCR